MDETERQSEDRGWDTAKTLAEALPFIQIYDRKTVVIKYGGHAMGESAVARQFAADVVLLKLMGVNPVVVHGGGPQISAMLDKAGVKSSFVDGLRVELASSQLLGKLDDTHPPQDRDRLVKGGARAVGNLRAACVQRRAVCEMVVLCGCCVDGRVGGWVGCAVAGGRRAGGPGVRGEG